MKNNLMEENQPEFIRKNIDDVKARIQHAAKNAGRDPGEITLVAVTKQKSAAVIKSLSEFGITHIGESYLKEALFKIDLFKDFPIEWHMIGAIQPGKEKTIAAKFAEVHSVENLKTANALNESALYNNKILPIYLEYNVSGEKTKHGWDAWNEKEWPGLMVNIEKILGFTNLKVKGLMTMAPYSSNAQDARPYFQKLRKLRDFMIEEIPGLKGMGLSMGMSGDFEVAIEEGATVLRIGSALVGPR